MNVVIYSRSSCSYCDMAKNWFKRNNIEFEERTLNDTKQRQRFYDDCGDNVNTVPQIFIDGKRIGGHSDLMRHRHEVLNRLR